MSCTWHKSRDMLIRELHELGSDAEIAASVRCLLNQETQCLRRDLNTCVEALIKIRDGSLPSYFKAYAREAIERIQ